VLNADGQGEHAFLNLVGGDASGELMHNAQCNATRRTDLARHLFPSAAGTLADLPSENGSHTNEGAQFWGELISEAAQLQLRGALKNSTPPEKPLFPNGLVPSQDGLHWIEPKNSARRYSLAK